ncbi:MAG: prepilin peptidase [Armatimonadetes bacterium]|nr:prepilin peptidase [Armatimonadota bacterium]
MNEFWITYWAVVAFVFGAIVGSFLNVCVWRLPRGESLVYPPSHCPACGHQLQIWPDMIPLISQLAYRSRCRYCGERFSWRYFWVELATGVAFSALTLRFGSNLWDLFPALIWIAALTVVVFVDLEHYIIPDVLPLIAVGAGVVREMGPVVFGGGSLQRPIPGTGWTAPVPLSLWGAIVCFIAMWALAALSSAAWGREAMGSGDSLLAAALGAFLWPIRLVVVALIIAVALGTVAGLTQAALAKRASATGGQEIERHAAAEDPLPPLPAASRVGRLLTVMGVGLALLAGWVLLPESDLQGIGGGPWVWSTVLVVAVCAIGMGAYRWWEGDRHWAPMADAAFEASPDLGPRYVPFGPYLVMGGLVAALFGDRLIQWYLAASGLAATGLVPGAILATP